MSHPWIARKTQHNSGERKLHFNKHFHQKLSCLLPNFTQTTITTEIVHYNFVAAGFLFRFFLKVSFSFFLISCCFAKSCYFEYFEMPRELFVDSFRGRRIYSQDSRIAIHFDCCEGETFSHLLKTYKLAMTQLTNRPTLFEFIKTACFGVKYLRYGGKNLIIYDI